MERQDHLSHIDRHVVLCNCNEKVKTIVEELHRGSQNPIDIVLIIQDRDLWETNPLWRPDSFVNHHFHTIEGCPTNKNTLRRAHIERARSAIILADPRHGEFADAQSTLIALAIEYNNPQVHTVIELIDSNNRIHLNATKIDEVVCHGEITEKLIAQSCITPGIKNIFEHLLSSNPGSNQIVLPPLPCHWRGHTYREIARTIIRSGAPCILCGFIQNLPHHADKSHEHSPRKKNIVLNPKAGYEPGKDAVLQEGDQLILIAHSLTKMTFVNRESILPDNIEWEKS
ncbi:MAG: hypothetical protein C4527_11840 [Candidatus Omnitrophota bacterium]|jgi:Trk K+ transport system NAD-binding subunit|nr:MAG: hypothetical protein C4527_11840 [Candidatus Omnitrophota bacterium]